MHSFSIIGTICLKGDDREVALSASQTLMNLVKHLPEPKMIALAHNDDLLRTLAYMLINEENYQEESIFMNCLQMICDISSIEQSKQDSEQAKISDHILSTLISCDLFEILHTLVLKK